MTDSYLVLQKIINIRHGGKDGITYQVLVDGALVWERTVYFGLKETHHAGGYAFVTVAQEQDRVAAKLADGRPILLELDLVA